MTIDGTQPKLDTFIHNLKTISTDDEGTLFYNQKKGMFEKQNYTNWFVNALKVLFVSPIRYMFGFTSNNETVYKGLERLAIETEEALRAKPDDVQAIELLELIIKVKVVTLATLIKEKHEARLYAQEAALIRLQEQIFAVNNPQRLAPNLPKPPLQSERPQADESEKVIEKPIEPTLETAENPPVVGDEPMKISVSRGPPLRRLGVPKVIAKPISKEEQIVTLTNEVNDNKAKYTNLFNQHGQLTIEKRNNQNARKEKEKRQLVLKRAFEHAPKEFCSTKRRVEVYELEFAKLKEIHDTLHSVINQRETELQHAEPEKNIVITSVEGMKVEVDAEIFKQRLEESYETVREAGHLFRQKIEELDLSRAAYQHILDKEMKVGQEKGPIATFLAEQEQIKTDLILIAERQIQLDQQQEALIPIVNEAKRALNAKQRELDKLTGTVSLNGNAEDISSPRKVELDPNAILNFHKKKKDDLVRTISKNFSREHILKSPHST